MEHDIVRKYSDDRVKVSGWSERIQQYPYDCPSSTVGRAVYRTFGYTTKHFLPRTSTQEMGDAVWNRYLEKRRRQHASSADEACGRRTSTRPEVNHCPYITSYQSDFVDRFPAFRKLMMINASREGEK
ncbi:uncharacterized protein LOC131293009 [Anopheles ziemanni]|uniref:uncharacterized protein LOC131262408 n=1 Tax=Anopheles coustani TaxID=139045 RepID=UPI00265B2121|nr:uncharacterized protein LOC131262408 [Anopheles coustani]XP_058177070.1 uncharacterized protein LOC131293009 [Anopheles ziemanni]